jgi:carbamoyltransferase
MYTLGINAVYHDSSACLVRDGQVVAAAEEERFTGIKHGKRPIPFSTYELPFHAIHFCLQEAGLHLGDVEHVAYSYDPRLFADYKENSFIPLPLNPAGSQPQKDGSVWDPLFLSFLVNSPDHLWDGPPHHLQSRFKKNGKNVQWHFVPHHLAHAVSAYFPSPFPEAAVLTLDGRGEKATTSYYQAHEGQLEKISEVLMPHSLGILYERITQHLGFLHSSDEYKVMALASYGLPRYADDFREIIQWQGDGQYEIKDIDFTERFGPPREKGEKFRSKHFDIAHSLQVVLEETVLKMVHWLYAQAKSEYLCLAGGVALNCVLNARLRDYGPFEKIWVQPAAGDAGTALGAALWVDHEQRPNNGQRSYTMDHAYLGPVYSDDEIEKIIRWAKIPYSRMRNVAQETALLLAQDKIVGWFQGRMEFGPRALGARSLIASPMQATMQAKLNEIKDREDFRPVAPVVLEEEASKWFVNADSSPFMLFVYDVYPDKVDYIPAVRHVDNTARIQTIRRDQNPLYYDLIKAFNELTGVPVLINTSFNTQGKPIVCSPRDAIECFWTSPLDALVIGPFLLTKEA